jgi:hypothetical protein
VTDNKPLTEDRVRQIVRKEIADFGRCRTRAGAVKLFDELSGSMYTMTGLTHEEMQ